MIKLHEDIDGIEERKIRIVAREDSGKSFVRKGSHQRTVGAMTQAKAMAIMMR